jgi:hypothetical protein
VARGLLTHDEGGERISAAFSARFIDQLPELTADLPPAAAAQPVGWRVLGSHLATQVRHEVRTSVAGGLWSRRLLVAVLAAVLLLGIATTIGGLALHGLVDGAHHWHHHWDYDDN